MVKKIGFCTLGCRVNDYLSNYFQDTARRFGWQVVPWRDASADAYLINTCLVTRQAESKSRQAIRRLRRQNPTARIIVTGCLASLKSKDYPRPPEADHQFSKKEDLAKILAKISPPIKSTVGRTAKNASSSTRVRANLMIANGCNNSCSFCIVHTARGRLASRPAAEVLAEARQIIRRGIKELVITGVNLGSYGRDLNKHRAKNRQTGAPDLALPSLLEKIDRLPGLRRWRLSSLEPQEITPALTKVLSRAKKFCPFLHLPLQSGSDKILAKMDRPYSAKDFLDLTKKLRRAIPGLHLGADVIAGFPGESDQDLQQTCDLVKKVGFYRLHVFPFSARPGTPAAKMKPVDPAVIRRRVAELNNLRQELLNLVHQGLVGRTVKVLVEREEEMSARCYQAEGLTSDYVRVFFTAARSVIGKLVPLSITQARSESVLGRAAR